MRKLLIANRAEIAIRIARAAAEMEIETVMVAPADDEACLHTQRGDTFFKLEGQGAAAYLDIDQLVAVAKRESCDAVHPGYGFLSESAAFATACAEADLKFVGPTPKQLELLGDKLAARKIAFDLGVSILRGTTAVATPTEAKALLADLPAGTQLMVKAVAGGGGSVMYMYEEIY